MEKIERIKKAEKSLKAIKAKLEDRLTKTDFAMAEARKIAHKLDELEKSK
jgi:hypothetical protein